MMDLADFSALEASERIQRGELSAEQITTAYLKRIQELDGTIRAWAHLDPDYTLAQARRADVLRQSGVPLGPLHGLPVGIKDIIETADMPTENGSAMDAGRQPQCDAAVVSRLRSAGAIILGKTVTTECAYLAPGPTRNPKAPEHTPGGSSSGSAAAVASNMVALTVGTQTGGSIIRPASFCGVVGFKPSFGLIPRSGVLRHSPWLDTVGPITRTVGDAALLADVMAGYDPADPGSASQAPPRLLDTALSEPPVKPLLGFVKTSAWSEIDSDCAQGFAELQAELGDACHEVELPAVFAEAAKAQQRLAWTGMAQHLRRYQEQAKPETRAAIEQGLQFKAVDYLDALGLRTVLQAALDELFYRYDALITPATTGEAPHGLDSTGNNAFCVTWTLSGVPAITLPLLEGANGLPIGVQLIGRRGYDGRLLRTARWLLRTLGHPA